jgi:hypothetical protein
MVRIVVQNLQNKKGKCHRCHNTNIGVAEGTLKILDNKLIRICNCGTTTIFEEANSFPINRKPKIRM